MLRGLLKQISSGPEIQFIRSLDSGQFNSIRFDSNSTQFIHTRHKNKERMIMIIISDAARRKRGLMIFNVHINHPKNDESTPTNGMVIPWNNSRSMLKISTARHWIWWYKGLTLCQAIRKLALGKSNEWNDRNSPCGAIRKRNVWRH